MDAATLFHGISQPDRLEKNLNWGDNNIPESPRTVPFFSDRKSFDADKNHIVISNLLPLCTCDSIETTN